MNLWILLVATVGFLVGIVLVVLGRRQRYARVAAGQDPGNNLLPVIGIGIAVASLLSLTRAF